jgi:hypothetical protein
VRFEEETEGLGAGSVESASDGAQELSGQQSELQGVGVCPGPEGIVALSWSGLDSGMDIGATVRVGSFSAFTA